jgi:hypothetical protein
VTTPESIEFLDIRIQFSAGGRADELVLRRCGRCHALLMDTEESMQTHAAWHGRLGREARLASLGFGGGSGADL